MQTGNESRKLTTTEIAALPPGLVAAVDIAGVELVGRHHPLSRLSRTFRGYGLILVRGRRIFWPGLRGDFSRDPLEMSVLAHELVHVWQYANGMTLLSYILRDVISRLGSYFYRIVPGKPYVAYGYEQQAAMVEDWMRLNTGMFAHYSRTGIDKAALEAIVPFLK